MFGQHRLAPKHGRHRGGRAGRRGAVVSAAAVSAAASVAVSTAAAAAVSSAWSAHAHLAAQRRTQFVAARTTKVHKIKEAAVVFSEAAQQPAQPVVHGTGAAVGAAACDARKAGAAARVGRRRSRLRLGDQSLCQKHFTMAARRAASVGGYARRRANDAAASAVSSAEERGAKSDAAAGGGGDAAATRSRGWVAQMSAASACASDGGAITR